MIKNFTLLLMAFSFSFSIAFSQTTSGKLSLSKGQKMLVTSSVKSVSSMEMMGQAMNNTADVQSEFELSVTEKRDTSTLLTTTLTKMKITSAIMGQPMNFDSEKKEDLEGEMGKGIKAELNVPKEIELNNAAKIVNAKKAALTDDQSNMLEMMKSITGASKDDDNAASTAFQIVPAGKKAGDSWSDSSNADGVKVNRTFIIKEMKGNEATINFTGNQHSEKKMEQQGMEANITMDAKLSGEAIVDVNTGVAKQKTMLMEGTGSVDAMGQAIPLTIKVTTNSTVKSL